MLTRICTTLDVASLCAGTGAAASVWGAGVTGNTSRVGENRCPIDKILNNPGRNWCKIESELFLQLADLRSPPRAARVRDPHRMTSPGYNSQVDFLR